jgi:hypothetical protein
MPLRRMGECMYRAIFFLTSALVGGEWSDSRPGPVTPPERVPQIRPERRGKKDRDNFFLPLHLILCL